MNGDKLETFYAGKLGGDLLLRIYDKSAEVIQNGKKDWFWDLWGIGPQADVWRVEFQLRRPVLKQYGVQTLSDLYRKIGGIWKNLTERWFSVRLLDNESTERRSIHPFWKEVQKCAERFGPALAVKRSINGANTVSVDWYIPHLDGCIAAFAGCLGIDNREDALRELERRLKKRSEGDFRKKSIKKAISLGVSPCGGRND
jgi:hypothetical protein